MQLQLSLSEMIWHFLPYFNFLKWHNLICLNTGSLTLLKKDFVQVSLNIVVWDSLVSQT